MIIVGAKGFAKEVLQVIAIEQKVKKICFFDNISADLTDKLYKTFEILRSLEEAKSYLKNADKDFVLGVGIPAVRKKLYNLFKDLDANAKTIISNQASLGDFDVEIGEGSIIMQGVRITNSITIGKGCLINLNCTIGHDTNIGDFVELSPNVNISGRCTIGNLTSIGTNAIILPDVNIGANCMIGAGTLVLKDVPDNSVVVGVPGKIIRTNE